jgi:hypothetical protein
VKQFGIHVSLIEPAGVHTHVAGNVPMAARILPAYGDTRQTVAREVEQAMRKGLTPDRVAQIVVQSLDDPNPRLRYVVGGPARVIKIFLRFAPKRLITEQADPCGGGDGGERP